MKKGRASLLRQIRKNTPKNMIALTRFPVPTRWKGVRMRKRGRMLKMQAQTGRVVAPVRTAMKKTTEKKSRPA